jgi:hypothetical protein
MRGSIFLREHDRQHAGCLLRIARVFRAEFEIRVVVVDLEKELLTGDFEIAEVVLAVRVDERDRVAFSAVAREFYRMMGERANSAKEKPPRGQSSERRRINRSRRGRRAWQAPCQARARS